MSGVAGRCFLRVSSRCDGLCRFKDGMVCQDCNKIASNGEWEAAKEPYNAAVVIAAGDQLICTRTGCWQYIPKKKDQEYCTNCTREGFNRTALPLGEPSEGSRKRKRARSGSPCTPPPDPRRGSSRGSGRGSSRGSSRGNRLGLDAQANAIHTRIGAARQLLTTCVDTLEQLRRNMNEVEEQFEVIEQAQSNIHDDIVEIADQD